MSLAYPLIPGIWTWMSLGVIPLPGEADSGGEARLWAWGGPLQTHHQNLPFKKICRCLKCTFKCEQPPPGANRADISLGCRESQSGTRTPPEVWFSQLGCHSCKHSISLQVNPSPLWNMRSFVQKHGLEQPLIGGLKVWKYSPRLRKWASHLSGRFVCLAEELQFALWLQL